MTSVNPTDNPMFAAPPHNTYPVMPGGMAQVPLYPRSQAQVQLIPVNPPGLMPSMIGQPAQKALKEGKTLGAIQIIIGLIHIGFGSIMPILIPGYYVSISFFGGFVYWGGIWFIVSGSLSVAAEKYPRSLCLVNVDLGFNITSAVFSVIGIMLYITDLSINIICLYSAYCIHSYWIFSPGLAHSSLLLIFCILEFCVVCASCHFACQLACYQRNNTGMVFPNAYVANPAVIPGPANTPMTHSNEAQGST
nr:membrane-spanning 4-domains subfamily A member 8 [Manis javanica]XP_017533892.2 membrane-spanning 4-domains subfamily A member 8 [Manis javanica]